MSNRLRRRGFVSSMLLIVWLPGADVAIAQIGEETPTEERGMQTVNAIGSVSASRTELQRPKIRFNVTRADRPRLTDEQVIVRGRRGPSAYRRGIELATESFWDAFNDINSDDRFDVHCNYEAPTGTRIRQHVCRPQFLDDATSRAAQAFLGLDKGAAFGLQQIESSRAFRLQRVLESEVRNLAGSDPILIEEAEELNGQMENYDRARKQRN